MLGRVIPLIRELELLQSDQADALRNLVKPTIGRKSKDKLERIEPTDYDKSRNFADRISNYQSGVQAVQTELFFSHRKEGGATGRMVSWIGMKKGETFA